MATLKNVLAMCDTCGFVYPRKIMQLNSYKMVVCSTCFDGAFDLKNHPQNKAPNIRDDITIKDPRPDIGDRNLVWENCTFNWDDDKVRFWSNV